MKWTKRNDGRSNIGGGYESGEYVIYETFNSAELQEQYGGKRNNYYWALANSEKVIAYGKTAKELKQLAENI